MIELCIYKEDMKAFAWEKICAILNTDPYKAGISMLIYDIEEIEEESSKEHLQEDL